MSTFERHTLENGMRVLTAPMPQAQSVTCFVMCAAGSRYETWETNGIAHFAEHMFFKGTERRPTARDIAGEVDAIGGEFNAFTSTEYTGDFVDNIYEQVLYGDQPLGWMVIGHKDAVQNARRETFLEYLDRWYTPQRMVLGVGGRIEPGLLARAEELFGDVDGNGAGGPPPVEPVAADGPRVKIHRKDSDQA